MQQGNEETTIVYDTNVALRNVADFKRVMVSNFKGQLEAILKDPDEAKAFIANAMSLMQKTPDLIKCTPHTIFNGLMMVASLRLMPSAISGEAYLIPYKNKGVLEAQFQLGYQGLVTLFYRAGIDAVDGALVFEKDHFELNGTEIVHKINPLLSKGERGKRIGAYTKVTYRGQTTYRFMNGKDIVAHAEKFSKSYKSEYSPWNEKNDPEGVMWLKTVLKQHAKLLPKNETIFKAIDLDNRDSIISDRVAAAKADSESMKMGAHVLPPADEPVITHDEDKDTPPD
jgi:recombination protein RecT